MNARRLLGLLLAVAALSSCSDGAEDRPMATSPTAATTSASPRPTPSPTPGIPAAELQSALTRFVAIRNRAAAKYDDTLIRTVAAGPLLEQELADHKINRILKRKIPSLSLVNATGSVTPSGTWPQRLVVAADVKGKTDARIAGLAQRTAAGAPWVWTYLANLGGETVSQYMTWPPMPTGGNLRTPTRAELGRLAMAPAAAVQQLARDLSTQTQSLLFEGFRLTGSADEYQDELVSQAATMTPDKRPGTWAFGYGPAVALQTSLAGRIMVFATISMTWRYPVEPGTQAHWPPGPQLALAAKGRWYSTSLLDFEQLQVVLVMPPKGRGDIDVIGISRQRTGVGGV
ncbi:hypothetical protein ACQPYH_29365 [Kribbella sp. CA-245084]|uniref:hypothetical protein n=1 Tax=Kribbella sp. CA-245084 TaxID=3239940 RepID=UPI003D936D64